MYFEIVSTISVYPFRYTRTEVLPLLAVNYLRFMAISIPDRVNLRNKHKLKGKAEISCRVLCIYLCI